MRRLAISLLGLALGLVPAGARTQDTAADSEQHKHCHEHAQQAADAGARRYERKQAELDLPDAALVDQDGRQVRLRDLIGSEGLVAVNFIFTTCTTVCPISSAGFADFRKRLSASSPDASVRLISISIDPEHDTPGVLREYAKRFGADPSWRFLTGSRSEVDRVLRAFGTWVPNKMAHKPVTFLRAAGSEPWLRIDGFMSGSEQMAEYAALVP